MCTCLSVYLTTFPMSSRPHIRNRFVLIGDLALIIVSVLGSFALRLDVSELPFYFPAVLVMCAVGLIVKVPTYYFFGLYRRLWVYASTNELRLITIAVTTASVLTSGVMLLLIGFDLIKPGMPRGNYEVILDRKEAIFKAIAMAQPRDIVLIAGKGHETYQDISGIKSHFDDKEELRAALK